MSNQEVIVSAPVPSEDAVARKYQKRHSRHGAACRPFAIPMSLRRDYGEYSEDGSDKSLPGGPNLERSQNGGRAVSRLPCGLLHVCLETWDSKGCERCCAETRIAQMVKGSFLADLIVDAGIGFGAGVIASVILFRRRAWPIALGTGFGAGVAYSNCNFRLNPYVLPGTKVVVTETKQ
ncbi:hypothetical protein A1Q2_08333 [Trichosporon asahii var. asahii CBS 8904]|uniref:MICOS complex subunit MIC10 n=2 Tax=Trichosporon asahii var. asahii TaxID=189963 RepID=K1V9J3_TRIAC|nr:hypothetical protein A1Q1_02361 [Trichosporon asahii var. asahii CBS 2479]EJT48634.1 hypothetical protein A1Q1_02361 [Trichosporon asahii var. asahii CBS 2479]EKC97410.1 hypothetical protein A1Q2_08333 [Trichosporon asahii var. asahii CBS 8904]